MIYRIILMFPACALVSFAVLMLPRLVNMPREKRHIQIFYLPVAVIGVIVCSTLLTSMLEFINGIITVPWVHDLLARIFPSNHFSLSFMLIVFVLLNLVAVALFTGIMALAMIASHILLGFMPELEKDPPLWTQCHRFYKFGEKGSQVIDYYVLVRKWITVLKYGIFTGYLCMLLFLTIELYSAEPPVDTERLALLLRQTYLMPLLFCAFLSQFQYFLLGREPDTPPKAPKKHGSGSSVKSYDKMIEAVRRELAPALLSQIYKKQNRSALFDGDRDYMGQYALSEASSEATVVTDIALSLGASRSRRYSDALAVLTGGGNVIINDIYFGEFYLYLNAYLTRVLAQGRSAVFLCTDSMQADAVCENLNGFLTRFNALDPIWMVHTYREHLTNKMTDVLVCCDVDFAENRSGAVNDVMERLGLIVFCDAPSAYSLNCIKRDMLINRIKLQETAFSCVFFTGAGSDDIDAHIRDDFGADIESYESGLPVENLCLMVWKGEGIYGAQTAIGLSKQPHLGTALILAVYGAKYGIDRISIVPADGMPMGSYKKLLLTFDNELKHGFFEKHEKALKDIIDIYATDVYSHNELAVNIVHDTERNIPAMLATWLKYGGSSASMIHIISDDYLLRDYFCDNISYFYKNPSPVKRFVPYDTGFSKKELLESEIASLLITLNDTPMSESKLKEYAARIGFGTAEDERYADGFLCKAMGMLFPGYAPESIYKHFSFTLDRNYFECIPGVPDRFKEEYFIKLTDNGIAEELKDRYSLSQIILDNKVISTIPVSADDIYSYILPKQICSVNNTAYLVNSISSGKVYVETANENLYYSYEPISAVSVAYGDFPVREKENIYEINRCSARVERTVKGYFKLINGKRFNDNSMTEPYLLGESVRQVFETADVLSLRMRGDFGEQKEQTAALFCFMFNEITPSLYPRIFRSVSACSNIAGLTAGTEDTACRRILQLLPSVEKEQYSDGGEPKAIEQSDGEIIVHILELASPKYGLIHSLEVNFTKILGIMKDYLTWALSEEQKDRATFLKMGFEDFPGIFAVNKLMEWLETAVVEPIEFRSAVGEDSDVFVNHISECSYCGVPMMASSAKEMSGDRQMCPECCSSAVSGLKQLSECLKEARGFASANYGIEQPGFILPLFAGPPLIKRLRGARPHGKALVCYNPAIRLLLAEKNTPRKALVASMVSELADSWQRGQFRDVKDRPEVFEAFSMYAHNDYLRKNGGDALADSVEKELMEKEAVFKAYMAISERFGSGKPEDLAGLISSVLSEDVVPEQEEPPSE